MNKSINAYQKKANAIIEYVWFEGTDALMEGEAVCYNADFGTATAIDGRRANRVERPSSSNNNAFAGVAARNYSAQPAGQLIEINVPGSRGVMVALGVDTVIGVGMLTFQVGGGTGSGRFVKAGYPGRGSVIPRQTVTAVLEAGMTGAWSVAVDRVTLTVTSTAGIAAGDTVVLLGGKDEDSDGAQAIIPGKYAVASITSSTVMVLATAVASATPNGALTCTGYCYSGNPKCQADLLEGVESGGVEFVAPPATGGAAVMSYMVGGVTYVLGGLTVASAVANGALADGVFGLKKGFVCLGTLTTNGATVTPASAGKQLKVLDAIDTGAQGDPLALVLITLDAAAEYIHLEWLGAWMEKNHAGATLAAT